MKPSEITTFIKNRDVSALRDLISNGVLKIKNNKLTYADAEYADLQEERWDKLQHVKKIMLNSLYGALLQSGCRFFDKRIGQSTTLTGRQIAKHMAAKVNEIISGEYDHVGKAIIYGDSVTGDTKILTNNGEMTIEDLFDICAEKSTVGEKEYGVWCPHKVAGFDSFEDSAIMSNVSYFMRHKTKKKIYLIELQNGKAVKVTEDHSVIVDRDGFLKEVKPTEILDSDLMICLNRQSNMDTERTNLKLVKSLGEIEDYVYDISIEDQDPFFFANDILVHNTDSCYFSAYTTLKKDIDNGSIPWTRENVIKLYDQIGDEVNSTFVNFMEDSFHCPPERGEVIRAGREIVASKGLFITKKRYAVLYYDKEGKRADLDGSPGKIKAMGLDLKRSDTPAFVQDFLKKILEKVLTGAKEQEILDEISNFREVFRNKPSWEKGSPKRANNVAMYKDKEDQLGKATIPGHVRASINWNTLRRMNSDQQSMQIVDGSKVVVCKLKDNPMGFTSVAYPVDQLRLPSWFTNLPFDDAEMETVIIDNKIDNLIGVLKYDIQSTNKNSTFSKLFEF